MSFSSNVPLESWTSHKKLSSWIQSQIQQLKPSKVHLCDGSLQEFDQIAEEMVSQKKWVRLNEEKRPHSFWCRSHPDDVARVEEVTFICSPEKTEAGPTNHWHDPKKMKEKLRPLFAGCMQGRTMYVIPFCMGPYGSDKSYLAVQITDSPYVVENMYLMTRMGKKALQEIEKKGDFIPCLHSVGKPLKPGEEDSFWPCNPKSRCIAHFPEEREVWSFGSGYGGNALLGKKCLALRIASFMAKEEGWLAEHMLIVGITNPEGKKHYIAAAFPSACGKTNLALLAPTLPGWKVECLGDDIAWMKWGKDGRLWAINPEAGMFGVAPGTSLKTNPHMMETIAKNTIFTNVALTEEGDVWWEGKGPPSSALTDWKGNPWKMGSSEPAAHPNSRFTVSISQCPILDPAFEDPKGVPISAIIFGGRRKDTLPLVFESLSWQHGTFLGASLSSVTTAAAKGEVGKLRHDPFAMLPFCGYNMGEYFQHWLSLGENPSHKLPKIFSVNWFQKDEKENYLWPGFGENIRVLKWIFERVEGTKAAQKTAIGYLPNLEDIDTKGLSLPSGVLQKLLQVEKTLWQQEVEELKSYFKKFDSKFPKELQQELQKLEERLEGSV